jgi:hypothetical protein
LVISEESRWIQRRVFTQLVSIYLAQGKSLKEALDLASHASAQAAMCFEARFPSGQTVNTTAKTVDQSGQSSSRETVQEQPTQPADSGSRMHPNIGSFKPPPKEKST